ncbi:hypothetical protein HDU78_002599 [Chytriomyces hyalinus]|nr:hypothetical protein HDU78_002599 [Chytriomyces hyalinus]
MDDSKQTSSNKRGAFAKLASDEADDIEEDDDDNMRESSTVAFKTPTTSDAKPATRRRGGKNEETLYTLDEEQAMLKFYNIKSFDVNEWDMDPLEIGAELMANLHGIGGPLANTDVADGGAGGGADIGLPSSRIQKVRGGNIVSVKTIDSSDPMGIKQSIFGRKTPQQIDLDIYQKILVTHKNFDPKLFLKAVHNSTSYREVTDAGCRNLQTSIDKRAEVMKDLVKQHFAKFVNAKSTIDSFYEEMKTNNLISSELQGVAPFMKALDGLCVSARDTYSPLLDRKDKADKIRMALSLLDQWKFFFNLPSSLLESIKKDKFDAAVRDYNKGKYLMKSSFAAMEDANEPHLHTASAFALNVKAPVESPTEVSILSAELSPKSSTPQLHNPVPASHSVQPSIATSSNTKNSLLPETYRNVFEHVWNEVENITDQFRKQLFEELTHLEQPLDVQERVLRYLVDLNPEKDPVWFYLNYQYESIISQLNDVYEVHAVKMKDLKRSYSESLKTPSGSIPLPKPQYVGNVNLEDQQTEQNELEKEKDTEQKQQQKELHGSRAYLNSSNHLGDAAGEENAGGPKPRGRIKSGMYGSLFSTLDGAPVIRKTERFSLVQFRRAVACVHTKEFESSFTEEYDLHSWKATLKTVRNLCKAMSAMQDFWRLCKIYSEDRIQKTTEGVTSPVKTKRRADIKKMMKCQTMIRHIVELYSKLLSNCFHLDSDLADLRVSFKDASYFSAMSESNLPVTVSMPPFNVPNIPENVIGSPLQMKSEESVSADSGLVDSSLEQSSRDAVHSSGSIYNFSSKKANAPLMDSSNNIAAPRVVEPLANEVGWFLATSHPLMASHWSTKVMKELVTCFDEIKSFRVGGGTLIEERVLRCIGDIAAQVKRRCVDSICDGFVSESKRFCEYEDWTFDIDQRDSKLTLADTDLLGINSPTSPKPTLKEENLTSDATQSIKLYYRFLKTLLTSLHKVSTAPVCADLESPTDLTAFTSAPPSALGIFGVVDTNAGSGLSAPLKHTALAYHYEPPIASQDAPAGMLDNLVATLGIGLCEMLDGLEWLATRWGGESGVCVSAGVAGGTASGLAGAIMWDERKLEELMLPPHKKFQGEGFGGMAGVAVAAEDGLGRKKGTPAHRVSVEKRGKVIDTRKAESRSLVVLCNISYLRQNVIPKIVALLELKFKSIISSDINFVNDTCSHLNQMIFCNYIRRKSLNISGLVRAGVLYSGLDWNELKKPIEIRPYCHEILMSLVMVHSEVSDVSQKLVKHVLSSLFMSLGVDLLSAFRSIDRFSEMGAMQATLETEFIHQTLTMYESAQVTQIFGLIYDAIRCNTEAPTLDTSASSPTKVLSAAAIKEQNVELVKQYLIRAKQSTWMQFMCFRDDVAKKATPAEGPKSSTDSLSQTGIEKVVNSETARYEVAGSHQSGLDLREITSVRKSQPLDRVEQKEGV